MQVRRSRACGHCRFGSAWAAVEGAARNELVSAPLRSGARPPELVLAHASCLTPVSLCSCLGFVDKNSPFSSGLWELWETRRVFQGAAVRAQRDPQTRQLP